MQTVLLSNSESVSLDESIEITVLQTFSDCIRVQIKDPNSDPTIREETLYLKMDSLDIANRMDGSAMPSN